MTIKTIILENWKSYRGKFSIPTHKFCAIIGPNGAGKSNLMDAVSFVLGVKSSKLRGKNLKDQIHKPTGKGVTVNSASVEIIIEREMGEDSEGIQMLSFKRVIKMNNSSGYYFNNIPISWELYNEELKKINIFLRSRNFLVFQGDIESVATKSPMQLTELLEEVSGSAELSNEYEKKLSQKKIAEEKLSKHFDKRKVVLKEKRQILEQKNEAENYNQILKKLKKEKKNLLVAEYIDYKNSLEKVNNRLEKLEDFSDMKNKEDILRSEIENLKKEKIELDKKAVNNDENILKTTDSLEILKNELESIAEKIKKETKEVKKLEKSLSSLKKADNDSEQKKLNLKNELDKMSSKKEGYEKISEDQNHIFSSFNDSQKEKFSKLKTKFEAEAKIPNDSLNSVQELLKEKKEALTSAEERLRILRERESVTTAILAERKTLMRKLEKEVSEGSQSISEAEKKISRVNEEASKKEKKKKIYEKRLAKNNSKLEILQFDKQMSLRSQQRLKIFNELKTAFPEDVLGFVSDFIKPIKSRFKIAVAASIGAANMDAIVVREREDGLKCISLLKKRRLGTAIFIPLQGLNVKKPQDDLRRINRGVKLVLDLMSFKSEHSNLALFLVGSTLCAESVELAREICFGRERMRKRVKVVTEDGVIISKNGNMTGGASYKLEMSARKFDESEITSTEKENKKILKKLEELEQNDNDTKTELLNRIENIKRKNRFSKGKIESLEKIILNIVQEQGKIKEIIKKEEEERNNIDSKLVGVRKKENLVLKEIETIRVKTFGTFCKENGIENTKEFFENLIHFKKQRDIRILEISNEENRIREKLEYEKSRSLKYEVKEKTKRLKEQKTSLKNANNEKKGILNRILEVKNELDNAKKQAEEKKNDQRKTKHKLEKTNEELSAIREQISKTSREKSLMQNEQEKLKTAEKDILVRADIEDIEVEKETKKAEKKRRIPLNAEETRKKCLAEISRLEKELTNLCPNLRSLEQFEKVEGRAVEVSKEFQSVKKECLESIKQFKEVDERRSDLFLKAFDHVEKEIGNVYKQLTESEKYPLGGNAYLTLENRDCQPFKHGTVFNAMPPSKRFREIESLSGGEKSVAALALLFAVHSYRPAPFFILDEIDAALDSANVSQVVRFVEEKVRKERLQCIVISLKESFYHRADELVGVYKDRATSSSGILTFDLAHYFKTNSVEKILEEAGSAISKRGETFALDLSSFEGESNL